MRRRGQRRLKNDILFLLPTNLAIVLSYFPLFVSVKTITKLNQGHCKAFEIKINNLPLCLTFSGQRRIWSFHLRCYLKRTAKKCTKNYNAHVQPLFCSLNLLFSDVPVAIAVVVFLSSLITIKPHL